jgi:hypothetical protein
LQSSLGRPLVPNLAVPFLFDVFELDGVAVLVDLACLFGFPARQLLFSNIG